MVNQQPSGGWWQTPWEFDVEMFISHVVGFWDLISSSLTGRVGGSGKVGQREKHREIYSKYIYLASLYQTRKLKYFFSGLNTLSFIHSFNTVQKSLSLVLIKHYLNKTIRHCSNSHTDVAVAVLLRERIVDRRSPPTWLSCCGIEIHPCVLVLCCLCVQGYSGLTGVVSTLIFCALWVLAYSLGCCFLL